MNDKDTADKNCYMCGKPVGVEDSITVQVEDAPREWVKLCGDCYSRLRHGGDVR